jgi:hypothetical protein
VGNCDAHSVSFSKQRGGGGERRVCHGFVAAAARSCDASAACVLTLSYKEVWSAYWEGEEEIRVAGGSAIAARFEGLTLRIVTPRAQLRLSEAVGFGSGRQALKRRSQRQGIHPLRRRVLGFGFGLGRRYATRGGRPGARRRIGPRSGGWWAAPTPHPRQTSRRHYWTHKALRGR